MNSKAYKTYELTRNEYRELKYFCLQYYEKKRKLAEIGSLKAVRYDRTAYSCEIPKPTEEAAIRRRQLEHDIDLIETALELVADEPVRSYLRKSVVNAQVSYNNFFDIPMGRQQFFELRRKFFFTLKQLKSG